MNKFSKDLVKSLGEAADHAEGRASSARVWWSKCPTCAPAEAFLHAIVMRSREISEALKS